MTDKRQPGWAMPHGANKWHYFSTDLFSLCMRWVFSGETQPGNDDSPENCAECRRRLAKESVATKPSPRLRRSVGLN